MKRYSEFDTKLVLKTIEDNYYFFDEYYDEWDLTSASNLIKDGVKDKKEVSVRIDTNHYCYFEGHQLTPKEVSKSAALTNFLDNADVDKEDCIIKFKVLKLKGKQLNKTLFNPDDEENDTKYVDRDCPSCGHLLEINEIQNLKSGGSYQCSNWDCKYKIIENPIWKKWNLEKDLKLNSTGDYHFVELKGLQLEYIGKNYPHLLKADKNFRDLYPSDEKLDDEYLICDNCGAHDATYAYGTSIGKPPKGNISVLYTCRNCYGIRLSSTMMLDSSWDGLIDGLFETLGGDQQDD